MGWYQRRVHGEYISCNMKFVSIAIVAAALVVCAAALHPDHLAEDVYQSMWEDFKSTHEKEYTSAEEPFRFLIFKDNVDQINRHNAEFSAGKQSFTMGVTQFADLTKHEFQAYYLNFKPSQAPKSGRVHTFSGSVVDLPTSVNWVTKGAVTDVKNQGQCGSCWAFSTCAGIEGLMAVSGKGLNSLSPQELVDCLPLHCLGRLVPEVLVQERCLDLWLQERRPVDQRPHVGRCPAARLDRR